MFVAPHSEKDLAVVLLENRLHGRIAALSAAEKLQGGLYAEGVWFRPFSRTIRRRSVSLIEREGSVLSVVGEESGACLGDSGGPLLDAEGLLVGILTRGAANCVGRDEYEEIAAVQQWLDSLSPSPRGRPGPLCQPDRDSEPPEN